MLGDVGGGGIGADADDVDDDSALWLVIRGYCIVVRWRMVERCFARGCIGSMQERWREQVSVDGVEAVRSAFYLFSCSQHFRRATFPGIPKYLVVTPRSHVSQMSVFKIE
jgi:hypothetical protein